MVLVLAPNKTPSFVKDETPVPPSLTSRTDERIRLVIVVLPVRTWLKLLAAPPPTPKAPIYLAPLIYTDLPVKSTPFGKLSPIKFSTPL